MFLQAFINLLMNLFTVPFIFYFLILGYNLLYFSEYIGKPGKLDGKAQGA